MKVRTPGNAIKASRLFTDREEPRTAFWKKYELFKEEMLLESNIHVLTYYGIGGIGKSSLLKKLMSEIDEKLSKTRYVYFDFNVYQESRAVLESLKNKLTDTYKFNFPLFELGSYIYAKKVGEGSDSPEIKRLTEKSPFLNLVISIVGNIPIAGIAAQILSLADQGIAYIRTYLKNHQRELVQIEKMEPDKLYQYLPYLFAQDMAHNLENAKEPLVIFLDTYERLVNELSSIGEPLNNDLWIRGENGIVQNIPNVLWVIAGREKLKWERFDSDWQDALEQHNLGDLSFADSDQFLASCGVEGSELRQQLYNLTNGTPVYLDLCVDQFMRLTAKGILPDITMFGDSTHDLIERFVRYMGDLQKDLVYMLACMQNWSDELITDIAGTVLPNFSLSTYEKVKDFSFIIQSDDGRYNIHQTVGEVLLSNCPELLKNRTAEHIIDYFSKKIQAQNVLSPEYTISLNYIMQSGLILHQDHEKLRVFYGSQVWTNLTKLAEAGRLEQANAIFNPLWERAQQKKSNLLYFTLLGDRAYHLYLTGDYAQAVKLAEKSFNRCMDFLGEDDLHTIKAMNDLTVFLKAAGQYQKALPLNEKVLEKHRLILGENHPDTLRSMGNLASAFSLLGQCESAAELYKQVLEKRRKILGEDHPDTLKSMGALALVLDKLGQYEETLKLEEQVLAKRRKLLGEDHPETIKAMSHLAGTFASLGQYEKSLELNRQVLEKRREILGENHPDTLRAIGSLSFTLEGLGQYEESLKLDEQLLDKRRKILGEDHPDTLRSMYNLAVALGNLGQHEKALILEEQVFAKRSKILGENHPNTLNSKRNLILTLKALGREDDADDLIKRLQKS